FEAGGHARPPPRHRGRCFPGLAERNTCPSGPTVRGAYNLSTSRVCCGGRANELWKKPQKLLPASRYLWRSYSQGRKTCRPACAATNEIRVGHQFEDGKCARYHAATDVRHSR